MRLPLHEVIAGTTFKATWVNSGMTPGTISSALRDRSEAIVSSTAAVSSLNGFYYALMQVPASTGWYVNEWIAVIGVNTYCSRQLIRSLRGDVD